MQGAMRFTRGLFRQALWVQIWVGILMLANAVGPILFIRQLEAQVVLAAFALAGVMMAFITSATGFSRLLGLGHFHWFVLLGFLWTRLESHPATDTFGMWLRATIVINAISLSFDVTDVVRYLRGEREETVAGL